MGEVVRHRAPREARTHARAGRKAVRVVAEAQRVGALELDGEVGRAAVVLGIEPVGLAAGRAADLDDLYSDAREPVHDRFARRAGSLRREPDTSAHTMG